MSLNSDEVGKGRIDDVDHMGGKDWNHYMLPCQRKHERCQRDSNLGQQGLVLRNEKNLLLEQQLEENLQYILN